MKSYIVKSAVLILTMLLLVGCAPMNTNEPTKTSSTTKGVDGYDVLGGFWQVYGVYYQRREEVLPLFEVDGLAGLYENTALTFHEDGTFEYYNLFIYKGTYTRRSDDTFLLKQEHAYKWTDAEGDIQQEEISNASARSFLLTIQPDGLLRFSEMDPMTGQEIVDGMPLAFQKATD